MKLPYEPQHRGFMTQIYDLGSRTQAPNTLTLAPTSPSLVVHRHHHHTPTVINSNTNIQPPLEVATPKTSMVVGLLRWGLGFNGGMVMRFAIPVAVVQFMTAATRIKRQQLDSRWRRRRLNSNGNYSRHPVRICAFCECEFQEDIGDEIAAIKVRKSGVCRRIFLLCTP
ncbi:Chromatin modification-related protein [Actinidia chinensis var. chinensis]|uniref:Chromatin modification-related protein n=1 Tax=Actinidia chinensis var. chinensis TaxID=1590841 RepID=A0A2R6R0P1_ACTCC|nr:Chromatin modification-related protein [Actinidia chinensis var. chinensis]